MLIHWIPLLLGLVLGLIPPKLLITSECRYLRFDDMWNRLANPIKIKQRRRRWWKLPLVWIDPIRGYFVGQQLTQAFEPLGGARGVQLLWPMAVTLFVLAITLWVQTLGRRSEGETLSPCGFLGGMMVALLPLVVALSAIALGISTAIMMSRFAAGYIIAGAATAGIGYVFLGKSPWLAGYTVLVVVPLLIAWLRRASLVMPVRC